MGKKTTVGRCCIAALAVTWGAASAALADAPAASRSQGPPAAGTSAAGAVVVAGTSAGAAAAAGTSAAGAAAAAGTSAAGAAAAVPAAPWTLSRALRAAETAPGRVALAQLRAAEVAAQQAAARARSRWRNPQLTWSMNTVPDLETEHTVLVKQRVDLSGRRALRSTASRLRAQSAQLRAQRRQSLLRQQVRRRFYALLAAQQRHRALVAWLARLTEAQRVVAARHRVGEVARYDDLRLARERRVARARLAEAAAAREAAWQGLSVWLGEPPASGWPRVQGALLPQATAGGAPRAALATLARRPDLAARQLDARALRSEGRAAARRWFPALTLGAGWRHLSGAEGGGHGLALQLGLPLGVQDRGGAAAAALSARADVVDAARSFDQRRALASARSAATRAHLLATAARAFERARATETPALLRTATAGYRGGVVSVTAWLDAHRVATQDALRSVAMAARARAAALVLHQTLGGQP